MERDPSGGWSGWVAWRSGGCTGAAGSMPKRRVQRGIGVRIASEASGTDCSIAAGVSRDWAEAGRLRCRPGSVARGAVSSCNGLAIACLPLWSRALEGTRSVGLEWRTRVGDGGGHPKGAGAPACGCPGDSPTTRVQLAEAEGNSEYRQGCPMRQGHLKVRGWGRMRVETSRRMNEMKWVAAEGEICCQAKWSGRRKAKVVKECAADEGKWCGIGRM